LSSENRSATGSDPSLQKRVFLETSSFGEAPIGEHPDDESWLSATWNKAKYWTIGGPKSLSDQSLFHKVALIPVLAWVGMGADGLSSSAYGPEESFKALGEHLYLAPLVILASMLTIFIISVAYSRVIEHFPHGGGGYVVASKLLGPYAGLTSGCALMVDYMLTITVSVTAGGDALFSLPILAPYLHYKLATEFFGLFVLVLLNLRGVKESVLAVSPIFFAFVVSHVILIAGSLFFHGTEIPRVVNDVQTGLGNGLQTLGVLGLATIFFKSYSMGAGTYTGIEAVSNGLGILREPQVETGKRTMVYMALSLALVAGGLFLGYLVAGVHPTPGQTLASVLATNVFQQPLFGNGSLSVTLIFITLISEAGLLFIAAQTGFIDGPRVMANMALDSWFPKRFGALSERFTMQNGVLIFGLGSTLALLYTGGNTDILVVMYSINVFITFSLTETSMITMYFKTRKSNPKWIQKIYIHIIGLLMCSSILVLMIIEKFLLGGWLTMLMTVVLIIFCLMIRNYYRNVKTKLRHLDEQIMNLPVEGPPVTDQLDPSKPTAIILVKGYDSVGIHSLFSVFHVFFPGHFQNVVFVSVGLVNSGNFKGGEALDELRHNVQDDLKKYEILARKMGIPAASEWGIGTETVEAATHLCLKAALQYGRVVVFGGKLIFQKERWYQRFMHNQSVQVIQNRLQWEGVPMTILPVRIFE
jgi:amino acid transporter